MIEIRNLSLNYSGNLVFSDINLTIADNTWIAILGQSGIGKSSLLRVLAGLTVADETITGKISDQLKHNIAYMAQTDLLLPWLNVLDNILISTRLKKTSRTIQLDLHDKAVYLLNKCELADYKDYLPMQLSLGMRQRVAIIRTLLADKPIVLMDEPFSALDAITRFELQALTAQLLKNKMVIFITHDPLEALRLADDIYILSGTPATLKKIVSLNGDKPRVIDDNIAHLQAKLYQELANRDLKNVT